MAKYGNENAAAGGTSSSTAGRDQSYGGKGFPDRPDKGPYGGWTTPNYGWQDAQLSDFGIMGALGNMIGGVYSGNVYAGRTPTGFTTGQSRDLGALGPSAQGNTGGKSYGGNYGSNQFPGSSGRSAAGIGLQQWNRMLAAQQPKPAPAPYQPTYRPPVTLDTKYLSANAPGLAEYGSYTPFYRWGQRPVSKPTEQGVK